MYRRKLAQRMKKVFSRRGRTGRVISIRTDDTLSKDIINRIRDHIPTEQRLCEHNISIILMRQWIKGT